MNDEYGAGTGDDTVDPGLACAEHRSAMVDASHRILGNRADAEDAANQAIAKVLADPPRETPDDWKAWLCRTAQYAAMDIRRRKKKEQELPVLVGGLLPDQFRHVELHLDTYPIRTLDLGGVEPLLRRLLGLPEVLKTTRKLVLELPTHG